MDQKEGTRGRGKHSSLRGKREYDPAVQPEKRDGGGGLNKGEDRGQSRLLANPLARQARRTGPVKEKGER